MHWQQRGEGIVCASHRSPSRRHVFLSRLQKIICFPMKQKWERRVSWGTEESRVFVCPWAAVLPREWAGCVHRLTWGVWAAGQEAKRKTLREQRDCLWCQLRRKLNSVSIRCRIDMCLKLRLARFYLRIHLLSVTRTKWSYCGEAHPQPANTLMMPLI